MSLNTSAPSYTAFTTLTAASLNALQDGIQAAWDTYTPTWAASITNPAIGNGNIAGLYLRIGKTILWHVTITMGSTTTYGSGQWLVSLPFTASSALPANAVVGVGGVNVAAGSSGPAYARLTVAGSTTAGLVAQGGLVAAGFPVSWVAGQSVTVAGAYLTA